MIFPFHSNLESLVVVVPFQIFADSLRGEIVRHVQCALSPVHLVESAWQQSVALFNELSEQKLINNLIYCLKQH